jgi:hypothetical protein
MADKPGFNIKKIKPIYLVAGGVAIIGGIFLAKRFAGGSGASTESAGGTTIVPPTVVNPIASIDDTVRLSEIERKLGDLGRGGGGDTGYPPLTQKPVSQDPPKPVPPPQTPAPKPPTQPIPPIGGVKPEIAFFQSIPPSATKAGEEIVFNWEVKNANGVTFSSYDGSKQTVAAKGPLRSKPNRAGTFTWTLTAHDNKGGAVKKTITRTVSPSARSDQPPPQNPPKTNPNVPGGYPETCAGVSGRPPDHPGRDIQKWAHGYVNGVGRGRWRTLSWAIWGSGVRIADWWNDKTQWPLINAERRKRGLKALNSAALQSFATLATERSRIGAGNVDKAWPDSVLQQVWEAYHLPYLC